MFALKFLVPLSVGIIQPMLLFVGLTLLTAASALSNPLIKRCSSIVLFCWAQIGRFFAYSRTCGSHVSDEEFHAMEAQFQANKKEPGGVKAQATINVFWHVIAADTTPSNGYIPYVL